MGIHKTFFVLSSLAAATLATQFTAEQEAFFKAHNIKTRVADMTPFDRYLHELHYPHINLDEIAAREQGSNYTTNSGFVTYNLVDFPQLILLLKSSGLKEIPFPNYQYETGWYFCYLGYCSGYLDVYDMKNGVIRNFVPAKASGGVTNGTIFWINYHGGHAEIQCPECTMDHTDLRQDPPNDSDQYFRRNFTMTAKNISVLTTFELHKNTTGLVMDKLDITLVVEDYSRRYQNATHTMPGGEQEEVGEYVVDTNEFISRWEDEEEEFEDYLQQYLNCFFSDGNVGEDCGYWLGNPYVHMSMGQVFHGLGLVAMTNKQPDNNPGSTCLADIFPNGQASDEVELINKILFKYATQVIQAGRVIPEAYDVWDYQISRFPLPYRYHFDCVRENCTGTSCDLIRDEIAAGTNANDDGDYDNHARLDGFQRNSATVKFTENRVSYTYAANDFRFVAGDFSRKITNLNTTVEDHFNGLELAIIDSYLQVESDFEFVGGKFVVSNFTVDLDFGDLLMKISNVTHYEQGVWTEMPAIERHFGSTVIELWNKPDESGRTLRERYSSLLEDKINQVFNGTVRL